MTTIVPIPGNPTTVRTAGATYTDVAQAVRDAAAEIRALAAESSSASSESVEALADSAGDVADRLMRIEERYSAAGSALEDYSQVLSDVQDRVDQLIRNHGDAAEEHRVAVNRVDYYTAEMAAATTADEVQQAAQMRRAWEGNRDDASAAMASAIRDYNDAIEQRDNAAQTARELIDAAVDNDGLNDSLWDNIKGWVADNAEWLTTLKDVLGWITAGLAILSFFIPVLAPFALAAAALTVGLSALLAASGQISWLEFGLDALMLVTAGLGAVAGRAVSASVKGLRAMRIARVAASGTSKNPVRVINGSFFGVQAPRVTLGQQIAWAREAMRWRGVANAQAVRFFERGVAGADDAIDMFLTTPAMLSLYTVRASAMVTGAARFADTAAASTGVAADLMGDLSGFFDDAGLSGLTGAFDSAEQLLDGVHTSHSDLHSATTLQAGSSW